VDQLVVFAKYWQPGSVKTRLAAGIGDQPACRVYRAFLKCLLAQLGSLADRHVLAFWPEPRRAAFARLAGPAWTVEPQQGNNLGQRMSRHLAAALAAGAARVVLIGSDAPTLPPQLVQEAFRRLRTVPVVLGPAADGGYYLVGVAGTVPPIFTDIAWSTADVWEQTVARLHAAACPFATLDPWYDVDTVADLVRLRDELTAPPRTEAPWRDLLTAVQEALAGQGRD
jgi:uncharacterized protein